MSDQVEDTSVAEPEEERIYTYREKALRDYFVKEYLSDYDETAAAIRIGYPINVAKQYAQRLMNEPYVRRSIKEKEESVDIPDNDPEIAKRRIIAGLIREANFRGPGSSQAARVAALSRLASLHGMDPSNKPKEPEIPEGEGTFVVPGLLTPEEWKARAAKQQEELVNEKPNPSVMPTPPSIN